MLQNSRTGRQNGYSLVTWAAVFIVVLAAVLFIRTPLKRALQGKIIATTGYMFWTKWGSPAYQYKGDNTSFIKTETAQSVLARQTERDGYIRQDMDSALTEKSVSSGVEDGSQPVLRIFNLNDLQGGVNPPPPVVPPVVPPPTPPTNQYCYSQCNYLSGNELDACITACMGGSSTGTGGGGGGGGGCLLAGTKITLADGSTKPIEEIRLGERVLAYKAGSTAADQVVMLSLHPKFKGYLVVTTEDGSEIKVTGNHGIFIGSGYKRADRLKTGDTLYLQDNKVVKPRKIKSIVSKDERVDVYNLEVASLHNYFAQGVLVHNKMAKDPYSEDMQQ